VTKEISFNQQIATTCKAFQEQILKLEKEIEKIEFLSSKKKETPKDLRVRKLC